MASLLSPGQLQLVADRFKALADPSRLQILQALRTGECTVSDLTERTGMGQANVSKHLQLLLAHGFVSRRKQGLFAYYRLTDRRVFQLCDLMCGAVEEHAAARHRTASGRIAAR